MSGLLGQGVPVNRETLELAIERAAMSCARGPVQARVVSILIQDGHVRQTLEKVPAYMSPSSGTAWFWDGDFRLDKGSWANLKARMEAAGFRFEMKQDRDIDGKLHARSWRVFWMGA